MRCSLGNLPNRGSVLPSDWLTGWAVWIAWADVVWAAVLGRVLKRRDACGDALRELI